MSARTTSRPAPTPVNQLGALFERQHKYHPVRPYRWWEFRPTPPEAPEVFYPPVESYEEYVARRRARKPPGFWEDMGAAIGAAIFLILFWGPLFLAIKLLLGSL